MKKILSSQKSIRMLLLSVLMAALISMPQTAPVYAVSTGIAIDPGHGGIDKGTNYGKLYEKDITLDISKKIQSYLSKDGYKTSMTRKTDTSLYKLSRSGGSMQKRDLTVRTSLINSSSSSYFVSIHVNSNPKYTKASGSVVYYYGRSAKSKALAESIQKALNSIQVNGQKRSANKIQSADYFILKNTRAPGVLVETAFITNTQERKLLTQQDFRQKVAKAVVTGIEQYVKKK